MPHYTASKMQITDPRISQKLLDTLHATYIYRYAKDFCRVSETWLNVWCLHVILFMCLVQLYILVLLYKGFFFSSVSRYILSGIIQSYVAYICSKTDSFFNKNIQYANELSSPRLGMYCMVTFTKFHVKFYNAE